MSTTTNLKRRAEMTEKQVEQARQRGRENGPEPTQGTNNVAVVTAYIEGLEDLYAEELPGPFARYREIRDSVREGLGEAGYNAFRMAHLHTVMDALPDTYVAPDTRADRERVKAAFKSLRKVEVDGEKVTARMRFWCCGSCGSADLSQKGVTKAVWFSEQDDDSFNQYGYLKRYYGSGTTETLFLYHDGGPDVARAAVEALNAEGLNAEWNGDLDRRIEVTSAQ